MFFWSSLEMKFLHEFLPDWLTAERDQVSSDENKKADKRCMSSGIGITIAGGFKHFFMFNPNPGKRPNLTDIFQTGWKYVTSDLLDGFNNITLSIMFRSDLRSRLFQMTFELPKVRSLNLWKRSLETPQFENLQTAEPGVSSWCFLLSHLFLWC